MAYVNGRSLPILFHSAAFHGARRKKKLIRSLFMFNISLKFPLNPLFLVFSILCTAEQRLCSTLHRATAQHCGSDLCGLQHKEKQCQ